MFYTDVKYKRTKDNIKLKKKLYYRNFILTQTGYFAN